MIESRRRLVPVEDWRAVRVPEGVRVELIGGEVVLSPPPTSGQALIARNLLASLEQGVPDGHAALWGVEWEITDGSSDFLVGAPQPDLVVMEAVDVKRLIRPPLLAAEVLSPSDRRLLEHSGLTRIEAKRLDYATGGLNDYLEVDRASGVLTLTRYELHDGVLRAVDVATGAQALRVDRPFSYTVRPADLLPETRGQLGLMRDGSGLT